MRILIVSHALLAAELGAGQIALCLAAALRDRGHDAEAWSPESVTRERTWLAWRKERQDIQRFVEANGPFDVIDVYAVGASRRLGQRGHLVVRSVQPELLYLWHDLRTDLRHRAISLPRTVLHALLALAMGVDVLAGWRRAKLILCLGSGEREWMRARFPGWSAKLGSYVSAPPASERAGLLEVRSRRAGTQPEPGRVRFLWIGRWADHKGTGTLLRFIAERAAEFPADRFTIAGCGTDAVREVPEDWQRTGRVRIVPAFSRAELPALLAEHDAGLFTSAVEGWGLCLNEMLESGLPVFATAAGAVPDLKRFFPVSLLQFPPARQWTPVSASPEDLVANGYLQCFNWPAIAEEYERHVFKMLSRNDGRSGR